MITRPILFSTPMVQAILIGTKRQTRRVIKPQPDDEGLWDDESYPRAIESKLKGWNGVVELTGEYKEFKCPYGQVGDVLWVRESFASAYSIEGDFIGYLYKADGEFPIEKWKPSIHMPKEACRLFLQIKDIRVERLQEITRGDAISEGCPFPNIAAGHNPKEWFHNLWHKINGPTSWVKNPWVWVIEFERIKKPENFM